MLWVSSPGPLMALFYNLQCGTETEEVSLIELIVHCKLGSYDLITSLIIGRTFYIHDILYSTQ